ncbi:MAG: ABC transporter permease [Lentisphaeria bacterium]|nr:ABC transporter permease [Lentisphaeria bacterium]
MKESGSFFNPIFRREFTSLARAWKTKIVCVSFLAVLGGMLLMLWPSGGVQSIVTESSRQIFSMFFSVDLALILLMTPAFAASAITSERERGTYGALFSTLLSPWEILTGKLFSSVLLLILLVILSLPIAAVCALTGGVDALFMGKVIVLLFATAISYGILSLACSSIVTRTTTAVLLNYILVLILSGGTFLPSVLLTKLLPSGTALFQLIRSFSAFDALFFLLYPDSYKLTLNSTESSFLPNPFTVFLLFSLFLGVVSLIVFSLFVRKPELYRRRRKGEVFTGRKQAIRRKLTFPFYLMDPLKRKKPIGRFANPVFVAEMRSKLFSNPQFIVRSVCVIFIASLVLLTLTALQLSEEIQASAVRAAAVLFQIGIVALIAPGLSSSLITDEIDRGTFAALRMTDITPLTLILGKLKATFSYAFIFIASSVFILLAMAYLEPQTVFPDVSVADPGFWEALSEKVRNDPEWWSKFFETYRSIFLWVILLLLSTMTFLSAGLFASSIAKNTTSATVMSYAFAAFLCIVTFLPVPLQAKFSKSFAAFLLSLNPVAAAMQLTDGAFPLYPDLWQRYFVTAVLLNLALLGGAVARVYRLFRSGS